MTVVRPNKNRSRWNAVILFSALATAACFTSGIFLYAKSVSYRQEARSLEARLENSRLSNAEFKNRIFFLTDLENMKRFAEEKGLVKDPNPKWEIASL